MVLLLATEKSIRQAAEGEKQLHQNKSSDTWTILGLFALVLLFVVSATTGCGGSGTDTNIHQLAGRYDAELLRGTATKGGGGEFIALPDVTTHKDGSVTGSIVGLTNSNYGLVARYRDYQISGNLAWQTLQEARGGPARWLEGNVTVRDEKGVLDSTAKIFFWPE